MIVWLNGTFGAGKTTTARLVTAGSRRLRLFDPEPVGQLLRFSLPDHEVADFQDLPPWRTLVPAVADAIAAFTGQDLLAVQTVLVEAYWRELVEGSAVRGHEVRHVVLDAAPAVLHARIDADPEGHDIRAWRHEHVDAYRRARSWLLPAADLVVDTGALAAPEAAAEVAAFVAGISAPRI